MESLSQSISPDELFFEFNAQNGELNQVCVAVLFWSK
jgi:hypothetical protein